MRLVLFFLFLAAIRPLAAQPRADVFAPGIISTGSQFGLTLSPNGRHALWVESRGGRDSLVIMESTLRRGQWQKPKISALSSSGFAWRDIDPMYSPDGKTILFQSTRPVPGKAGRQGFDVWAVKKQGKGWSAPYHLPGHINTDSSESFTSITQHGDIYFTAIVPGGLGQNDIWVSRWKDGAYGPAENPGAPLNTAGRESNPFIAPDESYIIFFANRPDMLGDVDLYISFRHNGQWSEPKNLGPQINTAIGEFCPFYHPRQKRLYFSRIERRHGKIWEQLFTIPFDPERYR